MNSKILQLLSEPIVTGIIILFSFIFLTYFLPWLVKWFICKIFKKVTKFDLTINGIGLFCASNVKFHLSNNKNILLSGYCSKIYVKFNLFDRKSKSYFTIFFDKIIFNTNLHDFYDITKVLKKKNKSKSNVNTSSSKRINWFLKATKYYSFEIQKIVLLIKLSSTEKSPLIYLSGDEVQLCISPEINRINSQLSLGTAAGKIICPSLSNGQSNLLANFRSQINFDFIFIKKQKLLLHKFLVTIGPTKLLLLEEIFHELAQVTKYNYVEQPVVVSRAKKYEDKQILTTYLEFLPKECGVDFEKFEVSLIRIDVTRNLNLTWNKCYASILQPSDAIEDMRFSESSDTLKMLDLDIDLDKKPSMSDIPVEEILKFKTGCYGLNISSSVSTTTSWRRLELSGQVDVGSLSVKCRIDNPCLIINIDELVFWNELFLDANVLFNQLFPKANKNVISPQAKLKTDKFKFPSLHYTLKLEVNCSHRGQTINSDSLALIQIINNSSEAGLEFGLKTLVASYEADTSHNDADKIIQSIDLYSDINTAYCKLIRDLRSNRVDYIDYFHRWDTSVFMGNVFVWVHKNRAGCLMNQVQLEWSESLAAVTLKIFNTINLVKNMQPKTIDSDMPIISTSGSLMTAFVKMDFEMKLEHVDLFAISSKKTFIRQRINVIQLNKTSKELMEIDFKFCGMIYDIIDENQEIYGTTTDFNDINNHSSYFKRVCNIYQIKMEYFLDKRALTIHCLDKVDSFWDTSIHMCLRESFVNLHKIIKNIKLIQKSKQISMPEQKTKSHIFIELGNGIESKFCLSKNHDIVLRSNNVNVHVSQQRSKIMCHHVAIDCDGRQIITFLNFSWKEVVPTNKYRQDKEKLKLTDATNRALEIQADKILISFPYKYIFNECYHDIISIKKFIKKVHLDKAFSNQSTTSVSDTKQTIPPDYIICFKEFQLELKDDPFECQLLDNYLLLRDENEEHEKRILRMKSQLKKLVKNGGIYTEAEYQRCLYQLDLQKQSQYISRISSLRTCQANEPENNLFKWTITDLSLMSLSDSDFYGADNAIRHMRNIDADSPFPDGVSFSTLWCRMISLNADTWCFQMREYLKSLWTMKDLYVWGRLVVAERSATEISKRYVTVEVDEPWPNVVIERNMPTIKFFHDFSADMKENIICYGPNWESCFQWINISWELINRASRDPSPALPWWDKSRLRLHGRLWFVADVMDWYYPVSLDPYNNTEFFHWQWNGVRVNWENMKWVLEGDLGIFCRSASKYDGDCQLIAWPNLQLKINILWICNGDPNDHFSVTPTDPAHVKSTDHDTYYYFRSRNVNLDIEFNCNKTPTEEFPRCIFYTNILKFFEKFKSCIRRVSRPIRRGRYFNYFRKKKTVLGRHFKFITIKLNTPQLNLIYWLSLAKKTGVHMITGPISLSTQFQLELKQIEDNLHHRPQANWSIVQMKSQIRKSLRVWLIQRAEECPDDKCPSEKYRLFTEHDNKDLFHEKCRYEFIILSHLKYERLSSDYNRTCQNVSHESSTLNDCTDNSTNDQDLQPIHNLRLVDLKVRWTQTNRNLVYSMIDIYRHKTLLRKNLSAQALKSIQLQMPSNSYLDVKCNSLSHRSDQELSYKKVHNLIDERSNSEINLIEDKTSSLLMLSRKRASSASYSNKKQENNKNESQIIENDNPMLRQLLQEVDTAKLYAFCEEESKDVNVVDKLTGVALCKSNVKLSRKWHLELINSQVMLKTDQSSVYAIVSAAQTRLDSYEHMPIWKDSQLLTKSSIVGKLECMQYYATVGKVNPNIGQWLNTCDVEDQIDNEDLLSGTPEVVGCGKAVGGVVSTCVGHIDPIAAGITGSPDRDNSSKHSIKSENVGRIQLQRMISKCSCLVYYVNYDRADPIGLPQNLIPPLPLEEDEISHSSEGATTLTLLHSNLNVVTNSLQYHMIVEIINDLILYVEPRRKARDDRNKVEFSLLSEDQLKVTILRSQEYLRNLVHYQMRYERELWKVVVEEQISRIKPLERMIKQLKTDIEEKNSALSQCIAIYQQMRIQSQRRDLHLKSSFSRPSIATNQQQTPGSSNISNANSSQDNTKKILKSQSTSSDSMIRSSAEVIRRNEVCFEHATWRMTENDGQIGLCDVELRGFIYSKVTREDDSGAHSFELNTVKVESLVNNCFFKEVLMMDASSEMNIGGPVLRINLIERYPVGGIKVNEAMEICIAPLVLQISKLFYMTMMPFFFPGKNEEIEIEKGSDNMSFVKSESMELKRCIDNVGSDGVLLGQNIEMTDLDQFLGDTHSTAEVSSIPGFSTKLRKLASFTNLKARKKEKFVSTSDDNLSPCSSIEPTGYINAASTSEMVSLDIPRGSMTTEYSNFDEINDNMEVIKTKHASTLSSNLKVEDVINNQYPRVDKNNRTPDIISSDYYSTVDSSQHNSADRQNKKPGLDIHKTIIHANGKSEPSLVASSKDPLQLMAERAKQNYMFLYVKIHGFPIRLSYRGEKQKAFAINNFALNITPIEYHNRLWTWLDLNMEVKKSIKKQLVLEVLKQKFKIKKNPFSLVTSSSFNQIMKEEDREKKKMEMLLGVHALPKEVSKKRPNLIKRVILKK